MKRSKTRVWALRTMVAGLVLAILPIVLWGIFSLGCPNKFDEGSCEGATYLWLLIVSAPSGAVVSLVGLVIWLVVPLRKPLR